MPLRNFLNLVLPTEGVKCWVEISKDKKVIQGFTDTVDKLAEKLLEIDARGVDAYFGCAAFKQPINRRAANALSAKAFWLDIDAGEGKPYATADDATDALDAFCDRLSLPLPGVVRSGGGLHAYWPIIHAIDGKEWLAAAKRLKLLAHDHGLHADPTRTADIASILRPPGTKNYKLSKEDIAAGRHHPAAPRGVEIDDWDFFSPHPTQDILSALYAEHSISAINTPLLHQSEKVNSSLKEKQSNLAVNINLASGITASKAFDPTKGITEGGRNEACTRYAGELFAKGHDFNEVLQLCLKWNDLNHPPMDAAEVRTTVTSIAHRHQQNHPAPPAPATMANLPELPFGYKWGSAGELTVAIKVPSLTEKDKFDIEHKTVSQRPVFLDALMNTEGHDQKNSYLFQQFHSKKGWQKILMNAKEMNSQEWYSCWFERGGELIAGADKYFKTYVREASNMLRKPGDEKTRYSQFGWKDGDEAFLVGDSLCKSDGTVEQAFGTDKLTPLMKAMMPARGGSLETWTLAADKLFTPGMEAHGFMLLAGFAAPLMKFCVDEGNGGAVLSVISEDSGKGKTPLAGGIASIWGELGSTIITGNFTDNRGIEELVRHCHLPLVKEEAAYSDPEVAALGMEKFTSGTDRGRLTQSGSSAGTPERYQTIMLSLSNKSLYNLVSMVNVPMSKRIFEVQIDDLSEELIANLGGITREMMRNCGYAGLQFARLIVAPQMRKYIIEHLTGNNNGEVGSVQQKYRRLLISQPEHRFIVWLLSSIEVAARIVTHCGILHFDVDRIMNWATKEAYTKIHLASTAEERQSEKLNDFLSEHIDNCLTVSGPFTSKSGELKPLKVPSRSLYMRMEMRNEKLYISHAALTRWCTKKNMNFIKFGKELKESGLLLASSKLITLGSGTGYASTRILCWEIDMGHPSISGNLRLAMSEEDEERAAIMSEGKF